ncbi:MAG: ubiquinone biosynthesis protein Coq4 [Crocinitomix sp.]|jgi:ubiquinone biosynthesis protein Coq4
MRWKIVTWITIFATNLSHILVRKRPQYYAFKEYGQMAEGSLGKTYFQYLNMQNIPFKANLIRHDLKHVILGYKMNMPDELRIHAFLLGNRSYNPMAIAYLCLCVTIVPETLSMLKKDFKRGRATQCLKRINFQGHVHNNLEFCRSKFKISPLN